MLESAICLMVCIKQKRPERGVFIEALAETKSETYLVLSW